MTSPKDKFALRLLKAIRGTVKDREIRYVPEHFALAYQNGSLHLDNAYDEYERAGFFSKRKVIRGWVAGFRETLDREPPATFEAARGRILPYVRDVNYWQSVQLAARVQGDKELNIPVEPLGGELTLSAALDSERTIANLGTETLTGWGLGLSDVLKAAQLNMRMRTPAGLQQIHPGVWTSPYHDNYDASRIVLTEVITHLPLRGDPVAFAVHRDHLFVTGADDEPGLLFVAKAALELVQDRRRISGTPVRWRGGKWQAFAVPATSPAYEPLRRLRMMALALDYSGQKEMLEKLEGEDVFVATFSILESQDDHRRVSHCAWTEGVPTLLPITDRIALMQGSSEADMTSVMYDWQHVEGLCGSLMERREIGPPRVMVKEFPSAAMLTALAGEAPEKKPA
jgi:hypothetical protein